MKQKYQKKDIYLQKKGSKLFISYGWYNVIMKYQINHIDLEQKIRLN